MMLQLTFCLWFWKSVPHWDLVGKQMQCIVWGCPCWSKSRSFWICFVLTGFEGLSSLCFENMFCLPCRHHKWSYPFQPHCTPTSVSISRPSPMVMNQGGEIQIMKVIQNVTSSNSKDSNVSSDYGCANQHWSSPQSQWPPRPNTPCLKYAIQHTILQHKLIIT